jgi:hypothetical protein
LGTISKPSLPTPSRPFTRSGSKQITEVQMVNLMLGGPDALRKFLADQMRLWSEVVRENNINGDI